VSRIDNQRPINPKRAVMTEKEESKLRASFKDSPCEACGINDGTVVGAHLNFGDYGGMGIKARGMIAGLCCACHALLDGRDHDPHGRVRVLQQLCQKLLRDRAIQQREAL